MNKYIFILMLPFLAFATGCTEHKQGETAEAKLTYTCPMHPQVVQETAGTCPICGMDLVVFDRSNQDASLVLNNNQIALANIRTISIGDTSMSSDLRVNGRVIADPQNNSIVSARVGGRIEKLFKKEKGLQVNPGEPLFSIYSEELAGLQQEYLVAYAQLKQFPGDEQFVRIEKAAKQKLQLFGQTPKQINAIIQNNKVSPYTTWYAETSGNIAEVMATEGSYVEEGGAVLRLESYRNVWIEADLYSNEQDMAGIGKSLNVLLPGSNDPVSMTVSFVVPATIAGRQVVTVRGAIPNPGGKILPGMQAVVIVPRKVSGAMMLPVDAVIRDSRGAHVWREIGAGKFEPVAIHTGKEDASYVEVLHGLEKNDRIVVSGAYLLYSEYVLKKGGMNIGAASTTNHQH